MEHVTVWQWPLQLVDVEAPGMIPGQHLVSPYYICNWNVPESGELCLTWLVCHQNWRCYCLFSVLLWHVCLSIVTLVSIQCVIVTLVSIQCVIVTLVSNQCVIGTLVSIQCVIMTLVSIHFVMVTLVSI